MTTRNTMDKDFADLDSNTTRMTRQGKTHETTREQVPTNNPAKSPTSAKPVFDPRLPMVEWKKGTGVITEEPREKKPEAPTSFSFKDKKKQAAMEGRAEDAGKKPKVKRDYRKGYKAIANAARQSDDDESSGGSSAEPPSALAQANQNIYNSLAARRTTQSS
jgi:hypothetical protein